MSIRIEEYTHSGARAWVNPEVVLPGGTPGTFPLFDRTAIQRHNESVLGIRPALRSATPSLGDVPFPFCKDFILVSNINTTLNQILWVLVDDGAHFTLYDGDDAEALFVFQGE